MRKHAFAGRNTQHPNNYTMGPRKKGSIKLAKVVLAGLIKRTLACLISGCLSLFDCLMYHKKLLTIPPLSRLFFFFLHFCFTECWMDENLKRLCWSKFLPPSDFLLSFFLFSFFFFLFSFPIFRLSTSPYSGAKSETAKEVKNIFMWKMFWPLLTISLVSLQVLFASEQEWKVEQDYFWKLLAAGKLNITKVFFVYFL